ncbi:MAG: hypothetical protein ACTSR2_00950 [Candidatus Hodarchaeales archaeon]
MWDNGKPKSKYAIVLVGSTPYLPGVNGIVNALDYYGNNIDLHLIYDNDLPKDYEEKLKNSDLNYRLVLQPFSTLVEQMIKEWPKFSPRNKYHEHTYIRYWYLMKIKDEYKVTSCPDADSIIVNNITPWFEFVEGTRYLLTAQHLFMWSELEEYTKDKLLALLPIFNHPLICDPKIWFDVFKAMFEREAEFHESDMRCLNRVLLLKDRLKDVIPLLDCQWAGKYVWEGRLIERQLKGKFYLLGFPNIFRVNIIHGKWWGKGFREAQLRGAAPENREKMRQNLQLILKMYKRLNEEWKVRYPLNKEFE